MKKHFIAMTENPCTFENHIPAPLFRKSFSLDFLPEKASLSIAGLGFYILTVNGKDITLIRRYNADWNVTLNLQAADVNADGVVNGKDITLIRRYNADWPGVVLLPGLAAAS